MSYHDIIETHGADLRTFTQDSTDAAKQGIIELQEDYALQNLLKVETPGLEMTEMDPLADPQYQYGMDLDLYEKVKTKQEEIRTYEPGWEEKEFKRILEQDTKDWLGSKNKIFWVAKKQNGCNLNPRSKKNLASLKIKRLGTLVGWKRILAMLNCLTI